MSDYTPEMLRREIVTPLAKLLADFTNATDDLQKLMENGTIGPEGIPLSPKTAITSMGHIRRLYRKLKDNLDGSVDGTLWSKERDRQRKAEYRKQKSQRKS